MAVAPARIDIYTDSDMAKISGKNTITVTDAAGEEMDDGNTVLDDADRRHFSVGLRPNLPPGRYVVSFVTLSDADGDTDRGHFAFYVGNGPTAAQKALDAQLSGAAAAPVSRSRDHTTLYIGIAAIVLALLAASTALFMFRGRKRRP
jgi:methionine-rich copper-binding protein CopC